MINRENSSSSLWSNCRPDIQRRINALLNNQVEYFRLRVEFYRQLQNLQYEYNPKFEEILEKRRKIIDNSSDQQISQTIHSNSLSNFWLIVLKNLDFYDYTIQSRDELCLKYLHDIRCTVNSQDFILEFHFLPSNPYFIETILTKKYSIRFQLDESNPYRSYDGPEIDQCYGCTITWNLDHNLTIRKRLKRIRNKITGQIRFVRIEESIKSFFNFFSPPISPVNNFNQLTDEEQIRLETDIEFGLLLKQRVLPRAILYYTGEALPILNLQDDDESEFTSSDSSQ